MSQWSDKSAVVGLRSVVFHVASGLLTLIFLLLFPLILAPQPVVWAILRRYIGVQLWLLRVICGLGYRVEGLEHLPGGPCIVAARHEAMWETLFLPLLLDNPAVFLKDEILRYPLAGRVARKLDHIGVDRSGSLDRAKAAFERARALTQAGRRVLIFPNGTRNPEHRYRVQTGVAVLYRMLKLPCVPVVLDSGDYWVYRRWLRRPGVITVRILPPIPAGLRTSGFVARLEHDLAQPA